VERDATTVSDGLSQLVRAPSEPAAIVQALYTLGLLDSLEDDVLIAALANPAAVVRVHALRLGDRRFTDASTLLEAGLQMVDDPEPTVQLQLALSLGESEDSRVIAALASLARERGEVRWLHDAVLSSLANQGGVMLEHLLAAPDQLGSAEALLDPLCAAIAARSDAEEVSQALVMISTAHHPPAQTPCLTGLLRNARNLRKISLSKTGRSALDDLVASNVDEVSAEASSLAKVLRTESLLDRVARLERAALDLANLHLPAKDRLAIIAELAEDDGPEIAHTLLRAFADGTPAVREAILAALFGRRDRLPDVVRAMEKGTLSPAALDALQRATLLEHPDLQLRERAIELLSATSPAIEEHLPRYLAALEGPRDPQRGEVVFRQHCANCHKAHGIGYAVGPDLTAESQRSKETLVRDVLAPSESIASGYTTYVVTTTSGQTFTGLIANETANSLELVEAGGKRTTILRKDIDEIQASTVSMMPEKLYELITPEELADALAWLRSPPAQNTGASTNE